MKWLLAVVFMTTCAGFMNTIKIIYNNKKSVFPIITPTTNPGAIPIMNNEDILTKFDMAWFVVARSNEIHNNIPYKATVWGKDYVIWKTETNQYKALEDACPHKGAALSIGTVQNGNIVCPYHGYEYDGNGNLTVVPGMCFQPSPIYNAASFLVVEKNGWIYLNTYEAPQFTNENDLYLLKERIFEEPEATHPRMKPIYSEETFMTHPRIVTENSLDIMHIAFVHTFGNRDKPAPMYEDPPKEISPGYWRTSYLYKSGKDSLVKRLFQINRINIKNEFVLPHTTITRITFGRGFIYTIVTAACPINERETKLFVKSYRNFLTTRLLNGWFKSVIADTLKQDKKVIESITLENMNGKFNMKFDKIQNTYRTLYSKFIHM